MIRVTAISNQRLAQIFVDYMTTFNVVLTLSRNTQQVEIWLGDEQKLPLVQSEWKQFLLDPCNPCYQAASWQAGTLNSTLPYQGFFSLQTILQTVRNKAGRMTLSVMLLCGAIYILMQFVGDTTVMSWLAWPKNSRQYWQLWRWITHALLHFSLLHILFNLMWWWYLAGQVEKQLGSGKLLVLTILSAIFSGWGQSLFSGANFGGLSGVIYALIGYVWLITERVPGSGLILPRGVMVFSVIWLVVGLFNILALSIANSSHLCGLLIGLLIALWDTRTYLQV
ncbi:rhomboid family intramembrane serine protease GlpG [Candidatus Fukatsuia symbiotica]|uniref:Rhomboid family intramembrane serine protease GlpG n=1 Tax=Candidatus Fukatsuia symbiotica TaxID=1878942 RepID=A0A2U8IA73_9GAMM|nr:rhomboid family intramembrane serine protease GlpG [Candidatus Fukatsuia symbiotica]AWK14975.1 rhomboid family intramembrane serine protease GlpG [Candidatus Fukatsuia symbiotica]MEA9443770.1 rhomboid family intramembrane serine protease GlpG [Candidatus Fukatsuia symbiotica]